LLSIFDEEQRKRVRHMRSALLTPVNLGYIWVHEKHVPEASSRDDPVILQRRDVLFGSLLQCGISQLECLAVPESYKPTADFLRKRIVAWTDEPSTYGTCLFLVNEAFEKCLGKQFQRHPDFSKVNNLFLFVGDLLYALHRRKSMVCFLDLDELLSTIETLPPELSVPLRNLWALMHRAEPNLPVPRYELELRDITNLEQILSTSAFTDYEKESGKLELAGLPEDYSIIAAQRAAQRLVNANARLLRMKAAPIRLLNLTAKAIDAVFGKLPGALADFASGEAQRILGAEKRLVLYTAENLLFSVYLPHLFESQQRLRRQ
jgi:hypothetical protein